MRGDKGAMTWRPFLGTFLAVIGIALTIRSAEMILVDPYDTGRLTFLTVHGGDEGSISLSKASLGRDPAFDSAIIGNSTIQLLKPARLDTLTGHRFVQLFVPGSWAPEQLAILHWFLGHHRDDGSIVILDIDHNWCRPGLAPTPETIINPFPFWLFAESDYRYLGGLLWDGSFQLADHRLLQLLRHKPLERSDSFVDYEIGRHSDLTEVRQRLHAPLKPPLQSVTPGANRGETAAGFPAFTPLAQELAKAPASLRKIVIFPPLHAAILMPPDAPNAKILMACHAAAVAALKDIPNTLFLDFAVDSPVTREDANFWDSAHYRGGVAERMEKAIGETLQGMPPEQAVARALDLELLSPSGMR